MRKYKFEKTTCSQCGRSFGPGDSGYSHCEDHAQVKSMANKKRQLEDLQTFAIMSCIDIFKDYEWKEVCEQCPPSIQKAWEIGKALSNLS